MVRPSYVLGGRAMQIIHDETMLQTYLLDTVPGLVPEDIKQRYPNDKTGQINTLLGKNPLLFDSYLTNAIEVDVDCLCDGKDVFVSGIMEHIEEAGIHSGDSACSLPVHSLSTEIVDELERQTTALARALNVGGLMNVQYAIKDGTIYVLEVNPRASRTVPFVAKTIGRPIAKIAARIMAGESLDDAFAALWREARPAATSAISRSRKPSSPSPASPASTRCSGPKCARPAKSWASTTTSRWPSPRPARRRRRPAALGHGVRLGARRGQGARAARGPAAGRARLQGAWRPAARSAILAENGIEAQKINKVLEGRPHIEDAIRNRQVQLVFNTTDGKKAISDSKSLRRAALMQKVPYYTTMSGAAAVAEAIAALKAGSLEVRPLQEYFA